MYVNVKGYEIEYNPTHPLALNGSVAVHRSVLFEAVGVEDVMCHWCGKALAWDLPTHDPSRIEVDHLDGDRRNNDLANLVPVDRECNLRRQNAGNPADWQHTAPATTCAVPGCERARAKQTRGFRSTLFGSSVASQAPRTSRA